MCARPRRASSRCPVRSCSTGTSRTQAATAAALVDGWYRTGDLAEIDDDGYLTITGRAHATIRTGGETVAPSEVEAVLREHPAVADVAVVGVPDAGYGELVCAVVVARPAATPTLAELRTFAAARLTGFKLPRRLELVEEIPRTPATGQVQRHLVVAAADVELTAARGGPSH